MLKKYLSKFTVDILPSVFATVVGAYIVNYYIIPKAREDRPPAPAAAQSAPAPDKAAAKPAEAAAEVMNAAEPALTTPVKKTADKPVEKAVTERSEKADSGKSGEARRHAPVREKAVAKAEPPKSEPTKSEAPAIAPAPTPVLATVGTAPAGDANDLARAAIERLSRGDKADAPRASEASRAPERTVSAQPQIVPAPQPVQQVQPMQQLPPPIVVSKPNIENSQLERGEWSRGPRPPSDVPVPMREMQANAEERGGRTNVVEDVLSGARSMFDRVIPRPFER